jgi:hypothetical protein
VINSQGEPRVLLKRIPSSLTRGSIQVMRGGGGCNNVAGCSWTSSHGDFNLGLTVGKDR